jgi:hypothetical protein
LNTVVEVGPGFIAPAAAASGGGPGCSSRRRRRRAGLDKLFGGAGDDILDGRDDPRNSLYCSEGIDTALRDALDWVSNACENR